MTIIRHISNHRRTSIELLSKTSFESMSNIYQIVYRTTYNPHYTHWVPRNLNLNLLNWDLFVFLNFSFSLNQHSSNVINLCWRPKCRNSSHTHTHTQIINHVFIYLSYNAAFSILFKAWTYLVIINLFYNKIFITNFVKKALNLLITDKISC